MSNAPKPWEKGWCPSKLPKESKPKIKHPPDAKTRQGGIDRFHGKATSQLPKEVQKEINKRAAATTKRRKRLLSANEVLSNKNFDPMEFLVDTAKGEALFEDHPFLPVLHRYLEDVLDRLEFQDGFGVKGLLDQLKVESYGYLIDSYTPKELRVNVAKELMQYVRPKLKQTEHISGDKDQSGPATPLTEEEVKMFKKWFDEEF